MRGEPAHVCGAKVLVCVMRPNLLPYATIIWPKRPHYGFNTTIHNNYTKNGGPGRT